MGENFESALRYKMLQIDCVKISFQPVNSQSDDPFSRHRECLTQLLKEKTCFSSFILILIFYWQFIRLTQEPLSLEYLTDIWYWQGNREDAECSRNSDLY